MDSSTCVAYLIEKDSRFVFEFHYNPEFGTVNMRVYGKDGKFLAETGVKSDYENSISLHYSEEGEYQLCFEKLTPGPMEVYFEVNEHEEDTGELGVGKEDLNLLAKRISAYLS